MRLLLLLVVRLLVRPVLSARVPVRLQRCWVDAVGRFLLRGPRGATHHVTRVGGVPLLAIQPPTYVPDRAVLYLHGGAYVVGGCDSHRKLAAAVGQAAQAGVWLPDYRLAPEHPHPAALHDVLAVYSTLLEQGQDPGQLALVGDSAGGGLALALAVAVRDAGLPLPASVVLFSPWVDLGLGGRTVATRSRRDAMLSPGWLRWAANAYRGHTPVGDPACSPLFANLDGLPPILIQVGSEEILLSDALRLHGQATAADVDCQLELFQGMSHVFQLHYGMLDMADEAIGAAGRFVRTHDAEVAA